MSESLYQSALRRGRAVPVYMDGFNIAYTGSVKPYIGTDGLGSCSVVLIASKYAIILGHVSPRPNHANPLDDDAGNNHVRNYMSNFIRFYNANKDYFPLGSSSGVVCAVYKGEIALPDQLNIMRECLEKEGLSVNTSANYNVPFTEEHPDRGSVLVNGKDPNDVKVYIEGTLFPSLSPHRLEIAQPQQTCYWDGEYHVLTSNPSYVLINGSWVLRPCPAGTQWDGKYYVSTSNSAYVLSNGAWILRPKN